MFFILRKSVLLLLFQNECMADHCCLSSNMFSNKHKWEWECEMSMLEYFNSKCLHIVSEDDCVSLNPNLTDIKKREGLSAIFPKQCVNYFAFLKSFHFMIMGCLDSCSFLLENTNNDLYQECCGRVQQEDCCDVTWCNSQDISITTTYLRLLWPQLYICEIIEDAAGK